MTEATTTKKKGKRGVLRTDKSKLDSLRELDGSTVRVLEVVESGLYRVDARGRSRLVVADEIEFNVRSRF